MFKLKKQSFLFSTVILALSGIVCKVLGAIYKIPLTNILGSLGMGVYYIIYPIYAFLLTFVSSAFTNATSRMVSSQSAKGHYTTCKKIFVASLVLLAIISSIFATILCIMSQSIAKLQGLENAYICYLGIAPSIVAVAISSSFKGYFQGLQNMTPSAISQVLEQVVKLALGFTFASIFIKKGIVFGTLGALIGVTVSEFSSAVFFAIYYLIFSKKNAKELSTHEVVPAFLSVAGDVLKNAFPFVLSTLILPMSMLIDSFLIVNILKSSGFNKFFSTELLGLNSGVVNTLVSLPTTLSVALCMTIVPYISYALSRGEVGSASQKSALALKLTLIIALPCTFVFAIFSKPVLNTLYNMSAGELNVASTMLTMSAINVFYLSILQISTSLLQAMNKPYIPVISLSLALIIKVICEVVLISNPMLNIMGAVISNSICYIVSSLINMWYFRRHLNVKTSTYRGFLAPLIASVIMSLVIFFTMKILQNLVRDGLVTLLSFLAGGTVYLVAIILLGAFSKDEREVLFKLKRIKA